MAAMVDGQMQCVGTRTILSIPIVEGVVSGGVVGGSVPCVVVASRIGIGEVAAVVDGQMQCVGAGTVLLVQVVESVVPRYIEGVAMPDIVVTNRIGMG